MKAFDKKNQARTVIIHGHMFKNAGTTFDWSLQRNFGEYFLDHREDAAMRRGRKYLYRFIYDNPELLAISSHHIQFPVPIVPDVNIVSALFIRHPIDRIRSVYNFEKTQDVKTKGALAAKGKSFSEYVYWRMQDGNGTTISDFQVRFCTPLRVKNNKPISELRFKKALSFINNAPLVGVVERYDESMVIFEDYLKRLFPDIDLSYIPQNIGEISPQPLDARVNKLLDSLSNETKKLVLQNNHLDLAYYENANNLLDQRISEIPKFKAKLASFRKRCKALRDADSGNKPWLTQFMEWNLSQ